MAALHVVVVVVRPYACGEMRHGGWRRSRQIDELLASAGMAADVCATGRASGFDPRGMRDIARAGPRAWTWSHLSLRYRRPAVVGYTTAALRPRLGARADVQGAISAEALSALLARCRGVAIFQTGGGGALTRIVELGHAGVPVVAAGLAARSMHGWRHLTWVDEVGEIPEALPTPGMTPAAVDPWQVVRQQAERRMLAWLVG